MIVLIPLGLLVLLFGFFLVKETVSPSNISESPSWAIDKGKESLEAHLKDPRSVEYGDVWAGRFKGNPEAKGFLVACGYFNARNSFGGMNGQSRFIGSAANMVLTDELPGGEMMEMAWQQACVDDRVS